jgi:photosystem II stability/assembly factor-like uncharacterized protein
LKWQLNSDSTLPIIVNAPLKINSETAARQCDLSNSATSGRVAAISFAGLATWWILEPGPKGATQRLLVTDSGRSVSSTEISDLPSTKGQMEFTAMSKNDALITRPIPYGYQTTYETTNGGATWSKVKL